jgi:hypothetical protein
MNCTHVKKFKNVGNCLFKTRCKWENEVRGAKPPLEAAKE